MTEDNFWEIIKSSGAGRADCEEQTERLTSILAELPAEEIIEFDRIFFEKRVLAYRWDIWGVAYLMNGGCSDDGFEYFRCWLIGQGREAFERALQDPQTIADLVAEGDVECESLLYASSSAYQQVTGEDMPAVGRGHAPAEPAGEPWQEDDLGRRFPKVSKKFGAG